MKHGTGRVLPGLFAMVVVGTAQAQSPTCNISSTEFSKWFVSGKVTHNGLVTFANSVGFPRNNTVCDFYKWADQMFLWIASPLGQGLVLDSTVFYDVDLGATAPAPTYIPNTPDPSGVAQRLTLRGSKTQAIQPGGQAGGGDTLLSLNGSLVYFGLNANDVYAWFNTAVTNGVLPLSTPFPTTQTELNTIVAYAGKNGATLPDANALTIELKTAWVDVASVSNPADYITINASVPNYIGKQGDATWPISSTQPTIVKTLALVGMHVVGTVQGHPEMVWATIEHRNNAPDNTYFVSFGTPAIKTVPYDSTGAWNFMTNGGSRTGALDAMMTVNKTTGAVVASTNQGIIPNNVYRVMPFGSPPLPQFSNNNGQLVSLNKDITTMLANVTDVRSKYFLVGAVWTRNGSIPDSADDGVDQVGSTWLANSTMETYHQTDTQGCFGCHFASSSTGTSHLFSAKNAPLVPPPTKK